MNNPRCRLLVVDDDEDTRKLLKELLELEGFLVQTAGDGREALQVLRQPPAPDVILLDLMMPYMSGWEVLAEVRKIQRLAEIPVVVVSSLACSDVHLPSGVVGIPKPVHVAELKRVLARYCQLPHSVPTISLH